MRQEKGHISKIFKRQITNETELARKIPKIRVKMMMMITVVDVSKSKRGRG